MPVHGEHAGAARVRRERKMRSSWRHEQMAIQMVLAFGATPLERRSTEPEDSHQDRGERHELYYTAEFRKRLSRKGAIQHLCSRLLAGKSVWERHCVEDMGTVCPFVQILNYPAPQIVDTVLNFFHLLNLPVAEQVVEVPKVSSSSCPSRAVLEAPQVVEQLVVVPTIVSYSSLQQRSAEQIVDIPVPRGRGRRRRQGFLPGQASTASVAEQTADIPSSSGDLQGFRPRQSSTAVSEQNVSTSAPCRGGPRGGLHGFPPVQGSAVDFPVPLGDADEGVFGTFLRVKKKCEARCSLQVGTGRALELIHAGRLWRGGNWSIRAVRLLRTGPSHRGFRDRPALLLQPPDPGDQVDAAAWALLLRRGRRRRTGGGGRDARLRGPCSTALPDGGKRVLVAETALWGRTALSPSPWYGACVFVAECDSICVYD